MRLLLILAAVVLLLAVLGWISFSTEPGRSSINLETEEIRDDTGEMMREGSELLREAEEEVRDEPSPDDTSPANANSY